MAESLTPQTTPHTSTEPIILGAIDIGTNSIHMVVVKIKPQFPSFSIIAKEKDTVRLGDRDLKTGKLTPEAIDRALSALRRCQDLALSFGAQHLIAVATSATREAPNGQDFIRHVEQELGLQINLIAGPEEARRIYLGVLSGLEFNEQPHVIIDIGGGSTELILCDRTDARFLSSTKVGAVRLTQEFVHTDPITSQELTYLRAYVRGMLERPVEQILTHLKPGEVPRMIGTSGTIETLAILQARSQTEELPNPLNGYTVSRADLTKLTAELAALDYDDRTVFPGMSERRAEIIVAGAVILLEAMEMLGLEEISICERALREGIIVDWMLTHQLIADKLQYQSAVRDRSIYSIAKKYHVKLDYSERVAEFAVQLFDQLHGKLHFWNENERELLWAAGMLHNSGLYISHSAHHKHSYYLIRHAELLGYTDLEVELIANIARYHRKSKPKKKHPDYHDLSKPYRQRVDQLSAILRLAVACDRRQIGAIARVHCTYDSHHHTLQLHLHPTKPSDPCELELWSLDYKKDVFEEEYNVTVTATVG
jgi:exopolyphosphatase/guanosine-5'-triphosphate,3'-diphosphate pyrophosphatase